VAKHEKRHLKTFAVIWRYY